MEKEVLRAIEGISGYYVFTLIMFFVFFIGVVIWAFKADKGYIKKMSCIPFEKSNANSL